MAIATVFAGSTRFLPKVIHGLQLNPITLNRRSGWNLDRLSLAVKLAATMTGLVALSIAGVTWLSVNRHKQSFQQSLQYQAEILLETLDVSVADALSSGDRDFLNKLIQAIDRESSLVLGGRIFDKQGRVIGDAGEPVNLAVAEPDPLAQKLLENGEITYQWEREQLIVGRVIAVNKEVLGAMSLELSTADLQEQIYKSWQQGLQVAIASIVTGTILALLICKRLAYSLQNRMLVTQDKGDGDLTRRLENTSGAELENSNPVLNQMTGQLYLNLLRSGVLFKHLPTPITTLDADGRIVAFNDAAEQLFLYQREEVLGKSLAELAIAGPWRERLCAELEGDVSGTPKDLVGQWKEIRALRHDGQFFDADLSISCMDVEGVTFFTAIVQDITERKRMEGQLRYEALHDSLTGLLNRSGLNLCLQESFQRFKRGNRAPFALLFIDFDRFKVINDSLGHDIGDLLLENIARRLQTCIRETDFLARFGGDEFSVVIENIESLDQATGMCDCILQQLSSPFYLHGHRVAITASIGVVLSTTDHEAAGDILRDADIAMHCAKAAGKGQYSVFNAEMGYRALLHVQLEQDLKRALELREFSLNYQPIVASDTKALVGFEALLRWQHPDRGTVLPAEFIPIAEESGAIRSIGLWVLHEGCQQMVTWQEKFQLSAPPCLSVNLSGKQIAQSDLVERVERILGNTGFAPEQLKLEITETILMQDFELAFAQLSALKQLGIQIYIDDFGIGYSSFSYLNQLPINAIKIDRSFISATRSDGNNWKIVKTILTLAKSMGIYTISEGVEDSDQVAKLVTLGCSYLQGYFISKPLGVQDAESFLASTPLVPFATPAEKMPLQQAFQKEPGI